MNKTVELENNLLASYYEINVEETGWHNEVYFLCAKNGPAFIKVEKTRESYGASMKIKMTYHTRNGSVDHMVEGDIFLIDNEVIAKAKQLFGLNWYEDVVQPLLCQ